MDLDSSGIWLNRKEIGRIIKEVRERDLGMTQPELGVALGYAPSGAQGTIGDIEKGERALPEKKLAAFLRLSGLPVSRFMRPEVPGTDAAGLYEEGYRTAVAKMKKALEEMEREADDLSPPTSRSDVGDEETEAVRKEAAKLRRPPGKEPRAE